MSKRPSLFDRDFKYTPAIETDVKKTIERARKRMALAAKVQEENAKEVADKVKPLTQRKTAHG